MKSETPPSPATRDAEGMHCEETETHRQRAMRWAFDKDCGGNSLVKIVLLTLAVLSDEDGKVTLTEADLREEIRCKCTQPSVKAAVNVLLRLGYVQRSGDTFTLSDAGGASVESLSYGRQTPYGPKLTLYVPTALREKVLRRDGYRCQACGETRGLEVDHIHPRAKGGCHELGNLQALCGLCNATKKDMLPGDWEAYVAARRSRA